MQFNSPLRILPRICLCTMRSAILCIMCLAWLLAASGTPAPPRPSARVLPAEEQLALHTSLLSDGYVRVKAVLPEAEAVLWGERVLAASVQQTASCPPPTAAASLSSPPAGCSGLNAASFLRGRALDAADPLLLQLTHSPTLARLAAQAMNVTRVRLYQATSFIKRPGDAPSAWHQDAAACPLHTDRLVTLWLALAPTPPECGPLVFARASHLPGVPVPSLRSLTPAQRLQAMGKWSSAQVRNATGLSITRPLPLQAGDATLHLGWTLHAAPPNSHATQARAAIAVTYFADGAKVHPQLLEMVGGEEGGQEAELAVAGQQQGGSSSKGVAFKGQDGRELRVNLLEDDIDTWKAWLHTKPSILVPGAVVRDAALTPLLYDAMWDSTPGIPM
jgi:hypothetical protein